jgi:hypothetical protein
MRWMSGPLLAFVAATAAAGARAQECPTAQTAARGYVVERGESQKTEVFPDKDVIRTVMRYGGATLLETTQFQGLFSLDRNDRGRRTLFEPRSDLASLFPLKPGTQASAKFITQQGGQYGRLYVEMEISSEDEIVIGSCRYRILKIVRSESRSAAPPRYVDTEYYTPELKLILAREFRAGTDSASLIKYDRIYILPTRKAPAPAPPKSGRDKSRRL